MGNCLRLGISRVGLAWSKWRMSAKFKRKNLSIIILGMQAVGKSTIALRLYKFKRSLPDLNYVQTKGFNTYMVKRKKTTINIYDLGGHPSIQELWDHYYADAHGVIFVVDTSRQETVSEAGTLLSSVLSDHRIRGKPVLLLANKIDLDGVSEADLDSMLNLQQLVNSVRCLTRLDVSCATDLKNDKGIFEGFKWLISYIESNYVDLNTRVLSDTIEEKKREKARREAIKAARLQEKLELENVENSTSDPNPEDTETPQLSNGSAVHGTQSENDPQPSTPPEQVGNPITVTESPEKDRPQEATTTLPPPGIPEVFAASTQPENTHQRPISGPKHKEPQFFTPFSPKSEQPPPPPPQKKSDAIFPPINLNPFLVDQPIKLPRLKSPKSRPEIINRIEDHGDILNESKALIRNGYVHNENTLSANDQYYEEKGFRFRKISAARRLSPEGADSDDGIVNLAYEPTEDISSDSTPIGVRRHNFDGDPDNMEYPNKEILMVTTLAEVHKEYFKERKGSTSTHDSISVSASVMSEATEPMDDGQVSLPKEGEKVPENPKSSTGKGKTKKRFKFKSRKTAPEHSPSTEPPDERSLYPNGYTPGSRTSSATSKQSSISSKGPLAIATVANAWGSGTHIPEDGEVNQAKTSVVMDNEGNQLSSAGKY